MTRTPVTSSPPAGPRAPLTTRAVRLGPRSLVTLALVSAVGVVAFGRADSEMTFPINLKVTRSPVLHTIGLNDLIECVVSHLFPSSIV